MSETTCSVAVSRLEDYKVVDFLVISTTFEECVSKPDNKQAASANEL